MHVYEGSTILIVLAGYLNPKLNLHFVSQKFDGNTDQFMVVSHFLKKAIIARFIRIVPLTWYGAVTLRADFYGCKSGDRLF